MTTSDVIERNRFEFGKNWRRFLSVINDERILEAQRSLQQMLNLERLDGKTFLDIGAGSGLFSLAASRLGAKVRSFDFDPDAVECTRLLKQRYAPELADWIIERGSVLDPEYMNSLGRFDIVYSWGVLHHTGAMWQALENAADRVAIGGHLFIALYNDQGGASHRWKIVKRLYNRSPKMFRWLLILAVGLYFESRSVLIRLFKLQNPLPFKEWAVQSRTRGMSVWYNLVDWVGGYPFEVAKPEDVFDFYWRRGFILTKLKTCGSGHGCNEFVFKKKSASGPVG